MHSGRCSQNHDRAGINFAQVFPMRNENSWSKAWSFSSFGRNEVTGTAEVSTFGASFDRLFPETLFRYAFCCHPWKSSQVPHSSGVQKACLATFSLSSSWQVCRAVRSLCSTSASNLCLKMLQNNSIHPVNFTVLLFLGPVFMWRQNICTCFIGYAQFRGTHQANEKTIYCT